jgi:hypothetical protein
MATTKEREATRQNVRKAATAAKAKKTIASLPKRPARPWANRERKWPNESEPAARSRRLDKNSMKRSNVGGSPGDQRWVGPNWPGH